MYLIPHSYPYLTKEDKKNVLSCFEKEYVGFDENLEKEIISKLKSDYRYNHIHTTPSCSVSLTLILKHLNLNSEDEIIMSAINCWSVYNIIANENCRPIICDVRSSKDFRADFKTIKSAITSRTKAIIITHMYGVLVEEKIIKRIRKKYPHIVIIEDFSTSLSLGKNKRIGRYSDYGISSFGSTKPLTGGIGGFIASKNIFFNTSYDQKASDLLSFNIKISRLNQALLLSQLDSIERYRLIKKQLLTFYSKFTLIYGKDEYNLFRAITFKNPDKILKFLKKHKLELDFRDSVQPNLSKELGLTSLKNSFNFDKYYSLPLNIVAFNQLEKKGLI